MKSELICNTNIYIYIYIYNIGQLMLFKHLWNSCRSYFKFNKYRFNININFANYKFII